MAGEREDEGLKRKKMGKQAQDTARVLYSGKKVINTIRMDITKLGNKRYFITFKAVKVASKSASSKRNAPNLIKLRIDILAWLG